MAGFMDIAELIRETSSTSEACESNGFDDQERLMRCERILRRLQEEELPDFEAIKESVFSSSRGTENRLSSREVENRLSSTGTENRSSSTGRENRVKEAVRLSSREVENRVKELVSVASHFLGANACQEDLVGPAASFLLQMFHDSFYANSTVWDTGDYKDHLSSVFDERLISSHVINQACDHSEFILRILEDNGQLNHFFNPIQDTVLPKSTETETPFSFQFREVPSEKLEPGERSEKVSKSGTNVSKSKMNVSKPGMNVSKPGVDVSWLYQQIEANQIGQSLGLGTEDMMEMFRSSLKDGSRSDEEIEEDLLGLLGESSLLFIRSVISNRPSLVSSFITLYEPEQETGSSSSNHSSSTQSNSNHSSSNQSSSNHSSSNHSSVMPLLLSLQKQRRPAVGQSIVVQTEEEKRLQKVLRKLQKRGRLRDVEKRNEKAEALVRSMAGPLFRESDVRLPESDVAEYPFVFDSFTQAKHSAAFVSGNKMVLPAGFKRDDNRRWEEMRIPASSKPPDHIVDTFRLIQVNDLDQVGQVGFAGMERLNQIQSVVFDAAYKSNENLLVCAPTGAGKTNIAMLAILHEIGKNVSQEGQVRLDGFKVVYIAPMKALVSEMVDNFSKRLKPFGVLVRELTGDMQMTRAEIAQTQMIVTTPEKWDVVTRKVTGIQLLQLVRLTIFDEIHILESDRGPVLEALIARIIRNVESTQQMSRLLALSATLPNYVDVAELLGVSLMKGLFFFDSRFRPVPLSLSFVGIKAHQMAQQVQDMDEVCYEKVREKVLEGHQVMVFVHARNATYKVAKMLRNEAFEEGDGHLFPVDSPEVAKALKLSRNKQLRELIPDGFSIHHAGLLRSDRNLVEKLFRDGAVRVLVSTSTLAWGVNLPAHAVVIRGTLIYDPNRGSFVDLSMLDVMQIFGRAGRPQYDTHGFACIITTHDKLAHYLSMLTNQYPIESKFIKHFTDNLNAEIVAGTVSTIDDAVDWTSYTYLFIRMRRNPLAYGLTYAEVQNDPMLLHMRAKLAIAAATQLHQAMMVLFDQHDGTLEPTDLGRTASHYYIKYDTVIVFNEMITDEMADDTLLAMVCRAQEFEQLKAREEEMEELHTLKNRSCHLKVPEGADTIVGKVNILLQAYLSRSRLECFSLISDSMFVCQNIVRLARGLFEYCRKSGRAQLARKTHLLARMFERQMWSFETPFYQFTRNELDFDVMKRLNGNSSLTPARLRSTELSDDEIGLLIRNQGKASTVRRLAKTLPYFEVEATPTLLTDTALRVTVRVKPLFLWNDFYHGKSEHVWIWMEDEDQTGILEDDCIPFSKKQVQEQQVLTVSFTVPVSPLTLGRKKYAIHLDSDRWLGCDSDLDLETNHLGSS